MMEKPIEQIVCAPFHVCVLEHRREETEKVGIFSDILGVCPGYQSYMNCHSVIQ